MNSNKIFSNGTKSLIQKTFGLVNSPIIFASATADLTTWNSIQVTPPGQPVAVASSRTTAPLPPPITNPSNSLNVSIVPPAINAGTQVDLTVSISGGVKNDTVVYTSTEV